MNLIDFEAVVEELRQHCIGGWIQKVHQPLPHTLSFDIRIPGHSFTFLLCPDPQFARIHFLSKKMDNPQTPPPFCQFLRAYVEGSRIEGVVQEPEDRVMYLTLVTPSSKYILVVALTGKQSNLYLLNESKKILQGLRNSWLKNGDYYAPPDHTRRLPHTSQSNPLSSVPPTVPSPLKEEGTKAGDFGNRFPVSAQIEEQYWKEEQDHRLSQLRKTQLSRVRKALKQTNKKIKGLQADLQKAENYREYGRYGELLKGQLHSFLKGRSSVTVIDYYDPDQPQLTLPLDSSKDPVWNMENYFKKHHKFLSAEKHLRPRLETVIQQGQRLQEELTKLEAGVELSMDALLPVLKNRKRGPMATEKQTTFHRTRASGYRQFQSIEGFPLLVGKTAKENDHLTFKVAGPDDLWLHARGTPGSHVVVRLEKGAAPPHETLKDAATLALWYSDLRKSGKGEVIYTHRKFVKKAKGQKAGTVTVSREKSIWIEIKEERLERLKGGAQ